MRSTTLNFINELRTVGIRISLSESMDAVQAVAAAGVEREILREALAACVVKEEEDRFAFDEVFERFFAGPARKDKKKPLPHSGEGVGQRTTKTTQSEHARPSERPQNKSDKKHFSPQSVQPQESESQKQKDKQKQKSQSLQPAKGAGENPDEEETQKQEKARLANRKALLHKSLSLFDSRDIEEAKELVEDLARRFRGHLSRRQRRTKRGRLDFRRTIRASISHGGALVDLRMRGRRPGKPDLVALCDLSGSVSTVSDFLLALLAPASDYFRHERTFAYVDRLCEVSFEQGYVVPHDDLDLYARSDFGQVLQDFWQTEGERALTRNTIVLILGDARNNRRPPRPDLLSQIHDHAKKLIWLNPEPRERWDTGDSVMSRYAPMCDAVLGCENLKELLGALKQAF
jgi:uncharacterized protein with von Willebrand factor type A (vWA) domain